MTLGTTIARALNELTAAWSADEEASAGELIDRMIPQIHEHETLRAPSRALSINGAHTKPRKAAPYRLQSEIEPTKRGRDECFEVLAGVCDMAIGDLTPSARGRLNRALAEIRTASPSVKPEEIRSRGFAFTKKWPTASLTPTSLALHWPSLGGNRAVLGDLKPVVPTEPSGWYAWLNSAYESNSYSPEGATPCDQWANLPGHVRTLILRECPQARRAAG